MTLIPLQKKEEISDKKYAFFVADSIDEVVTTLKVAAKNKFNTEYDMKFLGKDKKSLHVYYNSYAEYPRHILSSDSTDKISVTPTAEGCLLEIQLRSTLLNKPIEFTNQILEELYK
jgi:hypothetical protein